MPQGKYSTTKSRIIAAAGGLGTFAVQLAKAWGAKTVIGRANVGNHDYLCYLGAIPVTYGEGLADRVREVVPDGVDAVLDAAGPEALRASMELVKNKERIRTMIPSFLRSSERATSHDLLSLSISMLKEN